jgi:hypothetical protein
MIPFIFSKLSYVLETLYIILETYSNTIFNLACHSSIVAHEITHLLAFFDVSHTIFTH